MHLDEEMTGESAAVLRSDEPKPYLQFVEDTENVVAEFVEYSDYVPLIALLVGRNGSAGISLSMDLDELATLIRRLKTVIIYDELRIEWKNWNKSINLDISVDRQAVGPPVVCVVKLGDSLHDSGCISPGEAYECVYTVDLTWLTKFTSELERIIWRYKKGRELFESL
jgi:hypothetical protein